MDEPVKILKLGTFVLIATTEGFTCAITETKSGRIGLPASTTGGDQAGFIGVVAGGGGGSIVTGGSVVAGAGTGLTWGG